MEFTRESSGHEMSTHYFSCLGDTGTDLTKKHAGTHYVELVLLHPVGYFLVT
jgi:hypothetical protein